MTDEHVCGAPNDSKPGYCQRDVPRPSMRCRYHPRTVLEEPIDESAHERPDPDEFDVEFEIEKLE